MDAVFQFKCVIRNNKAECCLINRNGRKSITLKLIGCTETWNWLSCQSNVNGKRGLWSKPVYRTHTPDVLKAIVLWSTVKTHWGRVTHICVSDLTSICSDNGLSPGRHQAIIRTNAWILSIRPLGTNFSEFLVEILIFSFKKMRLKVSSAKRPPFCLGLNELSRDHISYTHFHLYGSPT